MFYASTAHIANDWLAIPLGVWLVAATPMLFGVVLAAGLLTKSYFLAFVPLFALRGKPKLATILIPVALAGPWYARNARLYGSLSAMPEAISGIGLKQVLRAVPSVPWGSSIAYMAHASLWTGNNNFNTFSRTTLDVVLLLLAIGAGCYLWRRRWSAAERITVAAILLFSAAIAYSTVVSFIYTQGRSPGASPWYMQVLLFPVLALVMLGYSRAGWAGRMLAVASVLLWAYVILASYAAKLVPAYLGYPNDTAHVSDLLHWYTQGHPWLTGLAPVPLLYALTAAVAAMAIFLAAALCTRLFSTADKQEVI
jgi:hypothetical protein